MKQKAASSSNIINEIPDENSAIDKVEESDNYEDDQDLEFGAESNKSDVKPSARNEPEFKEPIKAETTDFFSPPIKSNAVRGTGVRNNPQGVTSLSAMNNVNKTSS